MQSNVDMSKGIFILNQHLGLIEMFQTHD